MQYKPLFYLKHELLSDKENILSTKNLTSKGFFEGFERGVQKSFQIFDRIIILYKRYSSNVKLLMSEQKDVWKEWVKFYEYKSKITKSDYIQTYNKWLFDYAFSEIDNKKEELFSIQK